MLQTKEKSASAPTDTDCARDVESFAHSLTSDKIYYNSIISQKNKNSSIFIKIYFFKTFREAVTKIE